MDIIVVEAMRSNEQFSGETVLHPFKSSNHRLLIRAINTSPTFKNGPIGVEENILVFRSTLRINVTFRAVHSPRSL